jgi:ribosome-associated heat shock protein Hsp15
LHIITCSFAEVASTSDVPIAQVRLDVWLDVTCLFRTRSEAQKACKGGKVDVNGQSARPHREIRVGDEIRISRPAGRKQTVIVRGLAERHIAKAVARELYTDTTPAPSPEEIELRRLERVFRASTQAHPRRAPDRRERRALRQLRGK